MAPRGLPERAVGRAARVGAGALRLFDRTEDPLVLFGGGPHIFVHEGSRQAIERRMETAEGGPTLLSVTDNLRRMVSYSRERGALRVRVHLMFLGAPEPVVDALVRYVVLDDRRASQALGAFIDANFHRIRAPRPVRGPLRARGDVHDLGLLRRELLERYFGHAADEVQVTWGRRTQPRGAGRKAIKLGSYSAAERLIRLHPVLDRDWVPRYFVSYVLYHELLHHVVPWSETGGRSQFHSPEFRHLERQFPHYERALRWEQRNLARLLRAR